MMKESANTVKVGEGRRYGSPAHVLAVLILLAFVLDLVSASTRSMIQMDETAYVRMAENLAAGLGVTDITETAGYGSTHFSPGLPFFIVGAAFLFKDYIFSAYLVTALFGSLVLLPTYYLGRELISARVGLMAAALVAVTPVFVDYSSRVYSENVYIFFLLGAIVFAWKMLDRRTVLHSALTGVSLGLAYLANPSAIFYFLVFIVLALAVSVRKGSLLSMSKALAVFLIAFFIFALPYIFFLHGELGKWTFSGKASGPVYASIQDVRYGTLEWEDKFLGISANGEIRIIELQDGENIAGFIIRNPVQSARNIVRESKFFFTREFQKVIPFWFYPMIVIGLLTCVRDRRRAAAMGYLALMISPALIILAMYAHGRFFMPYVPMAMIPAAMGWQGIEAWGREKFSSALPGRKGKKNAKFIPWLIGAVVLLPVLAYSVSNLAEVNYPVEYKEAGLWIEQDAGGKSKIMSREYSAAYYAGGVAVMLPFDDYGRVTGYAESRGVDYLVIGRQELIDWRPQLMNLLEDEASHQDWKLVQKIESGNGGELLIFKSRRNPG